MDNYGFIIIPCGSRKHTGNRKAKYLYRGAFFKRNLEAALSLIGEDKILILSTKYGLIPLHKMIEPYSEYLAISSSKLKKDRFYKILKESHPLLEGKVLSFCSSVYETFLKHVYGTSIEITSYYSPNELLGDRLTKINKYLEELNARKN